MYTTQWVPYPESFTDVMRVHSSLLDVAEAVLDKCIKPTPWCDNPEDEYYNIAYNYEFIEDFSNPRFIIKHYGYTHGVGLC